MILAQALSIFAIDAKEYRSATLDSGDALILTLLVYGICAGIVLAAIYTLYQKSVPGSLVRALIAADATSPDKAVTLEALPLRFKKLLAFELEHNLVLGKTVQTVGEGSDVRYYIPEEQKYRAEGRFEKKGNGILSLVLTAALAFGLALLLFFIIPLVLSIV